MCTTLNSVAKSTKMILRNYQILNVDWLEFLKYLEL